MSFVVHSIQFNSEADHSVLNMRLDGDRTLPRPEWRNGVCHRPRDSPAGYIVGTASKQSFRVKVRLQRIDPDGPSEIKVRAVPDEAESGNHVLGSLCESTIRFGPDGISERQSFQLTKHRLADVGVGAWETAWLWQYHGGDSWVTFDRTEHQVFTVLGTPVEPWQQVPFEDDNIRIPWVAALEYACRWAQGARTLDDVAARVTRAIYNLGTSIFQYDCVFPGNSNYGCFALGSFLERLGGGEGRGPAIACGDCACAVTIFANLLGCELWKIDINTVPPDEDDPIADQFRLNPILAIGLKEWGIPCGLTGFSFHSIACKGDLEPNDRLFDACLMVNNNPDPDSADRSPRLPINMRFGSSGSGDYLDRLVHPESRHIIFPEAWGKFRPNIFAH